MTTNPFLWWVEPTSLIFEQAAKYCEKMTDAHLNTPLAPIFALGAITSATTAQNLTIIAESPDRHKIPEYSVEAGGIVCRPAAWN
ncbi:MAG: hypothetical protein R3D88_00875 [Alphaproteobacteria bacterium]|nr:hypothetical protein [Alphaproteobacteria bacterium]